MLHSDADGGVAPDTPEAWQATLVQWVPFDAARGEEGVSVQGSLLILLLVLIGLLLVQCITALITTRVISPLAPAGRAVARA